MWLTDEELTRLLAEIEVSARRRRESRLYLAVFVVVSAAGIIAAVAVHL